MSEVATTARQERVIWTPHPVLKIPTQDQVRYLIEQVGPEEAKRRLAEHHRKREEKIQLEQVDPLRHGYDAAMFGRLKSILVNYDEILVMGGNRLGKTRDAGKLTVADLVENSGKLWTFFDRSERASINKQQRLIHGMLPPEWRDLGKVGSDIYVKYTKATGFSNMQFILPNQSQGMFFNYKQDVNDFEGYEIDGAYFDELVPLAFYEAMAFRLGKDRPMKIIITFTPLENGGPAYTPVVQKFMAGAQVVETAPIAPEMHEMLRPDQRHAKDCPPGHLPVLMQCANPRACVLFYHWGCNPFGANQEVLAKLKGRPKAQWLVRAYGYVEKQVGAALPRFGPVHRITRTRFDEIARAGVTRYCVIDPGGTKNWFIKWYAVTPQGWRILYREWPDYHRYGAWALPPDRGDKIDWRPGEAQRIESGRGIDSYKRIMLELEGWRWDAQREEWDGSHSETIFRRLIDPRLGGQGVPSQEQGTSIIDLMGHETKTKSGKVALPRFLLEEAPGRHVQHGLQLLQEAMDWDESRPLNAHDNCPKWYVVDDLKHTEICYSEYTGLGTDKDALKDIIDPDRYFIESGYGYVDTDLFTQAARRRATHY
jgi:hypothetical protein